MVERNVAGSMDEYIAGFSSPARQLMEELRALVRALVPEAVERISWGMPTFDLYGKHLLHFAGYARHVGFYPMPGAIEAFKRELASYKTGKGSVQLPLDRPLPAGLIARMITYRVEEASRIDNSWGSPELEAGN